MFRNIDNHFRQKRAFIYYLIVAFFLSLILADFALLRANDLNSSLPPLKVHTLPKTLENWETKTESTDYLAQITPHLVGYFVFSQFPIKVYFDQPKQPINASNFSELRFQQWADAVKKAITDWNQYLPMVEVEKSTEADIVIKRQHPPIKTKINPETGLYDLARVRAAETRYKFYVSEKQPQLLLHQMSIDISPDQTNEYILSSVRHELGHALGIWGHSEQKTDIMYFSQVRDSPLISARDINTLKKIYQQPTRLGWALND